MNKIVTVFVLLFVFVGGFFVFYNRSRPSPEQKWETKPDDQSLVTVAVTPIEIGAAAKLWKFNVVLTTHSGSLDQDLVQVAELTDGQGRTYKPIAWEGAPVGGHHREGVLVFNAIAVAPTSVELKIKNIGGGPDRLFKWVKTGQ